jgi:hypothetical protein
MCIKLEHLGDLVTGGRKTIQGVPNRAQSLLCRCLDLNLCLFICVLLLFLFLFLFLLVLLALMVVVAYYYCCCCCRRESNCHCLCEVFVTKYTRTLNLSAMTSNIGIVAVLCLLT